MPSTLIEYMKRREREHFLEILKILCIQVDEIIWP